MCVCLLDYLVGFKSLLLCLAVISAECRIGQISRRGVMGIKSACGFDSARLCSVN